jgi:hypothetical protein
MLVLDVCSHTSPAFELEAPDGSSTSSSASAFFSFLGPPPNMEKTLSLTAEAASVAFSVTDEAGFDSAGFGSVISVVTFAVSSFCSVAPGAATCSAAGSGLAASAILTFGLVL